MIEDLSHKDLLEALRQHDEVDEWWFALPLRVKRYVKDHGGILKHLTDVAPNHPIPLNIDELKSISRPPLVAGPLHAVEHDSRPAVHDDYPMESGAGPKALR